MWQEGFVYTLCTDAPRLPSADNTSRSTFLVYVCPVIMNVLEKEIKIIPSLWNSNYLENPAMDVTIASSCFTYRTRRHGITVMTGYKYSPFHGLLQKGQERMPGCRSFL